MKNLLLALVMAFPLTACGNDPALKALGLGANPVLTIFQFRSAPAPLIATANDPAGMARVAALRAGLEQAGQPLILARNAELRFSTLLAPFGGNNGVETWSSIEYQTISLRDGVLVATRGFGPDLMSSVQPSIRTIAAARGTTQRRYSYLDGADQPQSYDFTCTLAGAGSESIDVMAKSYVTRKVTETCAGPTGRFTNEYWFDSGSNLRQSNQYFAPGPGAMFLQRVID